VLFTNAHPASLAIKDECTGVSGYLDAMFSSHTVSWPKRMRDSGKASAHSEPFDPERSIFVDDSPAVLAAARAAGIRWVIGLRHPDSQGTFARPRALARRDRITDLAGPDSGLI